ncbi:hypothetical protein [Microcoleus phage My-WqHQDG]|nr:hypothetical protein [Microcoleus phage My-WqHQDG]
MFDKMRSGDLVVFSGVDTIGDLITAATDSIYTHVGVVLVVNGRACILESIMRNDTSDVLSMQSQGGVVVRDLETIVQKARVDDAGMIWWAARTTPLTEEQVGKLTLLALDIQGTEYDYIQALSSPLDGLDDVLSRGIDPKEKLFCSELVVVCELAVTGMVYHHNHKVPINASTVVPKEVVELHVAGVPIWGELVAL